MELNREPNYIVITEYHDGDMLVSSYYFEASALESADRFDPDLHEKITVLKREDHSNLFRVMEIRHESADI